MKKNKQSFITKYVRYYIMYYGDPWGLPWKQITGFQFQTLQTVFEEKEMWRAAEEKTVQNIILN